MEYMFTKFGVDSSTFFLFECGQRDVTECLPTPAAIQPAWILSQ